MTEMDKDIERFFAEAPFRFDNSDWLSFCGKAKIKVSFPLIHIAGSNGKSSVCRILESIYLAAGYKVAALYDLNLLSLGEGIRWNGKSIEISDFCRLFKENQKLFAKFSLSDYEMRVAIAYRYFEEVKPDIVIVESAFGGAYDATNIDELNTVLCVVTSSGLTHTNLLGTTTSEIALNHAGILKEECPLLIGKLDENSTDALRDFAKKFGSKLSVVDDFHRAHLVGSNYHFDFAPFSDLALSTCALTYINDAAIALDGVRLLEPSFPVEEKAIREGLLDFSLPVRSEAIGNIILDCANNPEAIKAFLQGASALCKGKPLHVLFASKRNTNIASMLAILGNVSASINLTTFPSPYARNEEDYFLYISDYPYVDDPLLGLKGLKEKFPGDAILLIGDGEFAMKMREELL